MRLRMHALARLRAPRNGLARSQLHKAGCQALAKVIGGKSRNGADRLRTEMIFYISPTPWVFNPTPSATLAAPPTTVQQASESCKCRPFDTQRPPATAIVRRRPQKTVTV